MGVITKGEGEASRCHFLLEVLLWELDGLVSIHKWGYRPVWTLWPCSLITGLIRWEQPDSDDCSYQSSQQCLWGVTEHLDLRWTCQKYSHHGMILQPLPSFPPILLCSQSPDLSFLYKALTLPVPSKSSKSFSIPDPNIQTFKLQDCLTAWPILRMLQIFREWILFENMSIL